LSGLCWRRLQSSFRSLRTEGTIQYSDILHNMVGMGASDRGEKQVHLRLLHQSEMRNCEVSEKKGRRMRQNIHGDYMPLRDAPQTPATTLRWAELMPRTNQHVDIVRQSLHICGLAVWRGCCAFRIVVVRTVVTTEKLQATTSGVSARSRHARSGCVACQR